MGIEDNVRFPIVGLSVWSRIRNGLKRPILQSKRTVVAKQQRSMCRLSYGRSSNETDDSGQTDLSRRMDKGVFGLPDGCSLLAQRSNNIRVRGQRPRSDRWRWFEPRWRPVLQHRGRVWLSAVSQIRRWLGGHVCCMFEMIQLNAHYIKGRRVPAPLPEIGRAIICSGKSAN